jgi:uncharacterized protein (TIGR00369 family)
MAELLDPVDGMPSSSADRVAILQAEMPPFSKVLGIHLLCVEPERIVAEMPIRQELTTRHRAAHGGALMAFADTLGALGTIVNLPPGASTTTLESKTNFFAPGQPGSTVRGESVPLHRGRRTMVWQTRITGENGRLLAMVTQTQIVLEPKDGLEAKAPE